MEANKQILFRYVSPEGNVDTTYNPNGSLNNIAGIINKRKNVMGLMPHPNVVAILLLGTQTVLCCSNPLQKICLSKFVILCNFWQNQLLGNDIKNIEVIME